MLSLPSSIIISRLMARVVLTLQLDVRSQSVLPPIPSLPKDTRPSFAGKWLKTTLKMGIASSSAEPKSSQLEIPPLLPPVVTVKRTLVFKELRKTT